MLLGPQQHTYIYPGALSGRHPSRIGGCSYAIRQNKRSERRLRMGMVESPFIAAAVASPPCARYSQAAAILIW